MNHLQEMLKLINSNQDPPVDLYVLKGSDEGDNEIDSLNNKTLDTLLIGDKAINTIPVRETDELIKSSIDNLVLISKEYEVTTDSELECNMHATTPLPPTDVREEDFDINSPLGEYVVDFLMENVDVAGLPRHLEFEDISSLNLPELTPVIDESTLLVTLPSPYLVLGDEKIDLLLRDDLDTLITGYRKIDFNPCRDIEELEHLLANDPIPVPRMFDEPLGNFDSMSRPIEISDLILEELTTEIILDDLISTDIDDREVERFDLFFSLTQSGEETRVMDIPSFGLHHMPSPCPAAYSPLPSLPHIGMPDVAAFKNVKEISELTWHATWQPDPVDWRSTIVDRWLTDGPVVVRWWSEVLCRCPRFSTRWWQAWVRGKRFDGGSEGSDGDLVGSVVGSGHPSQQWNDLDATWSSFIGRSSCIKAGIRGASPKPIFGIYESVGGAKRQYYP
nr:hypothetical protein [Tanacetum cinerariifolium]